MRRTLLSIITLAVALPLAAQSQQKIVFMSGDTVITIERGERESCAVKVGDRSLSARQAESLCEQKGRTVTSNWYRAFEPTGRAELQFGLRSDSLFATQRKLEAVAEELASRQRSMPLQRFFSELPRGSMISQTSVIGASIDPRPRDTDRWGAYVAGVTPNYPAEKAGLRAGDIITSINGQSLTAGRTEGTASADESLVWLRLSETVRKLEPGKAVDLTYRRDGTNHTVKIAPVADNRWFATTVAPGARLSVLADSIDGRFLELASPEIREMMVEGRAPRSLTLSLASRIPNLELAPINEALGRYFGTTRGVLVLDTPAERNLGLEPGDVVTTVDGRTVDTPAELIRVLRTYDKDKSFTLQVIRQRQTRSITATLP